MPRVTLSLPRHHVMAKFHTGSRSSRTEQRKICPFVNLLVSKMCYVEPRDSAIEKLR